MNHSTKQNLKSSDFDIEINRCLKTMKLSESYNVSQSTRKIVTCTRFLPNQVFVGPYTRIVTEPAVCCLDGTATGVVTICVESTCCIPNTTSLEVPSVTERQELDSRTGSTTAVTLGNCVPP